MSEHQFTPETQFETQMGCSLSWRTKKKKDWKKDV